MATVSGCSDAGDVCLPASKRFSPSVSLYLVSATPTHKHISPIDSLLRTLSSPLLYYRGAGSTQLPKTLQSALNFSAVGRHFTRK